MKFVGTLTLVIASANASFATENYDKTPFIELASASNLVSSPINVDPIITGPTTTIRARGILPFIDACDADCQAKRLGLVFDQ